jgi:hypothetical protein
MTYLQGGRSYKCMEEHEEEEEEGRFNTWRRRRMINVGHV